MIDHDFIVQCGQHASQLSATLSSLATDVPFGDSFSFPSGWHTRHVDVQYLPTVLVVMSIRSTVSSKHRLVYLSHLIRVFLGARIQRVADGRLFGTAVSSKGLLQHLIRSHTRVHFHKPAPTCQNVDQSVQKFVPGRVFDRLLSDVHILLDHIPYAHPLHPPTNQCQTCTRGKPCILIHSDSSPFSEVLSLVLVSLWRLSLSIRLLIHR